MECNHNKMHTAYYDDEQLTKILSTLYVCKILKIIFIYANKF